MSRTSIIIIVVAVAMAFIAVLYSAQMVEAPTIETSSQATSTALAATTSISNVVKTVVAAATTTAKKIQEAASGGGWKSAIATVFWAGEPSDSDNGYISNTASAWDERWMQHFGGVDSDSDRCGFRPCAFEPKENPFYVALPYNDLDDEGNTKEDAKRVPWYTSSESSILKNHWVEVRASGKSCFGQWEDVGPFHEDDIEYVFGSATKPLNTELEKAGIDLSPAMRDCLNVDDVSNVQWRFVESSAVPDGDWKAIVSRINFY